MEMPQSCTKPLAISFHDDVFKWKHFPRYWPSVRGIHRSLMNSPHKGQWCRALMFSLICTWISAWVNHREAGDLRRHRTHYEVTLMFAVIGCQCIFSSQWIHMIYLPIFIRVDPLWNNLIHEVLHTTGSVILKVRNLLDTEQLYILHLHKWAYFVWIL